MKHITRAQRPHGRRSEYAKELPICASPTASPYSAWAIRWGGLVTLDEATKLREKEADAAVTFALKRGDENAEPPKSELCPVCVAKWVDIKLTKRWEQEGDALVRFIEDNFDENEPQGPSLAESVYL